MRVQDAVWWWRPGNLDIRTRLRTARVATGGEPREARIESGRRGVSSQMSDTSCTSSGMFSQSRLDES